MSEHSPSPWFRDEKNQWIIRDARGATLCEMYPWDVSGCREDDQADAHLVAAAPELLESLEEVLSFVAFIEDPVVLKARAVIKKATGE